MAGACISFFILLSVLPTALACGNRVDPTPSESPVERNASNTIEVKFYYREKNNVIGITWFGESDDVSAGVNWYFVEKNGTEILVGKMDWRGYHLLKSQYVQVGASFMDYGPPKQGNVSRVFLAGWLQVPTGLTGTYLIKGYGVTAEAKIVGRTYTYLSPSDDKFDPFSDYFGCMRPEDESRSADDKSEDLYLHEQIHWWIGTRHLATFTPSGRDGVPGKVEWVDHPDFRHKFFVDPLGGDLRVFGQDIVVRLECLRCIRQGPNYSSLSMLSCPDPVLNTRTSSASASDHPSGMEKFLDIMRFGMTVTIWTVVGATVGTVLCTLVSAALNALLRSCSCSRLLGCVEDVGKGAMGYKKLPVNEIV